MNFGDILILICLLITAIGLKLEINKTEREIAKRFEKLIDILEKH